MPIDFQSQFTIDQTAAKDVCIPMGSKPASDGDGDGDDPVQGLGDICPGCNGGSGK